MWYKSNLEHLLVVLSEVEHTTNFFHWQPSQPMWDVIDNNRLGKLLLMNHALICDFVGATIAAYRDSDGCLITQWLLDSKPGARS